MKALWFFLCGILLPGGFTFTQALADQTALREPLTFFNLNKKVMLQPVEGGYTLLQNQQTLSVQLSERVLVKAQRSVTEDELNLLLTRASPVTKAMVQEVDSRIVLTPDTTERISMYNCQQESIELSGFPL